MAQARATFGRSKARTNRARGWEVPEAAVGTSKAQRQRRQGEHGRAIVGKTRRALQRQRRRAAPKSNGNSATELGRASHSLLGAGVVVVKPLGDANADPKRRAAAPTALLGLVGTSLARWRGGAGLTLCRWKYRPTEGRFRFAKAARVVREDSPPKRKGRTARIFLAPPRHN